MEYIVDTINKKRLGKELTYLEFDNFFNGYMDGEIKDYQMSALLMAICINGMTDEETFALTKVFVDSGDVLCFDRYISGITVDKHSTGGIGDKTTLVVAPIVACCGVPVVKMSGRGLGFTGGTIDKLESIPGFNIDLTEDEFVKQVRDVGVVISGQTKNLVPMDKLIYALRDVTGTVSSMPLIASSIMSKKIADGADKIIIDIKVGNGALITKREDAEELSNLMIKIGKIYHKEVKTIISDMNIPLGRCVGNSIEVLEAMSILQGKEKDNNLYDLCIKLATHMVSMGKNVGLGIAKKEVLYALESGNAYAKFLELVKRQKGDIEKISVCSHKHYLKAYKTGVIKSINALEVGKLSFSLGAGRAMKEDSIKYDVGVELRKLVGDKVKRGDIIAVIYSDDKVKIDNLEEIFKII